jgi:hypothetical protein
MERILKLVRSTSTEISASKKTMIKVRALRAPSERFVWNMPQLNFGVKKLHHGGGSIGIYS